MEDEIKKYNIKVENIKREEHIRRKGHQDDLKYQMQEKQNFINKELQDKAYDERCAKLWEIEYQKKIDEQKEMHKQRVILLKAQFIKFYFFSLMKSRKEKEYNK